MKYHMELTFVIRGENENGLFDTQSIDCVVGKNLTEVLAQFQLLLALIHTRLLDDCKAENRIFDDDIPF